MNQGAEQGRSLTPGQVVDVRTLAGAVLASIPAVIMITDRDGRIMWVNHMFEHLTGYASGEVIGRNPRLLKSGQHSEAFYQELWSAVLAGKTWQGEVINRRKDGVLYHEEMTIAGVRNEQGEIGQFVAVKQDITNRKLAEKELLDHASATALANSALEQAHEEAEAARQHAEESKRELEVAQQQLVDANMKLAQADKMASVGRLAAGVAHEINNPIGFISSNLNSLGQYAGDLKRVLASHDELLQLCLKNPELKEKGEEVSKVKEQSDVEFIMSDLGNLIEESVEGANRVRDIVADLRDFSHIDSADVGDVDVNELMDKTINVAWNELKYKTEVVREYGTIPTIRGFGGKLGQVFLNLLVNAAQSIEERGTITVRTGQSGEDIWLEVADTGCGIPEQNIERVFEAFFTTKDVGEGMGLGLHMVHGIIQVHGGRITVESRVGEGTTFRIELPVTGPPETQEKENVSVA